MPETLALGIGNVLCGDDGAGCRAVEHLYSLFDYGPDVCIQDGGCLGHELLELVCSSKRLLVVDCVDFGLKPGEIRIDEDLPFWLGANKLSPHQSSFAEILAYAMLLGKAPECRALVGIQPAVVDFGLGLSKGIRARIPDLARACALILKKWGHEGKKRAEPAWLSDTDLAWQNYER